MFRHVKILSALLLVLLTILFVFARGPFVIVTFFIATILVALLINISKIRIFGIEFATFLGVVTAIAYDPLTGAILSAILITVHMLIANYTGPYMVWVIPSYAVGSYVAGLIGGGVATTGLYATILIDGICLLFTMIFYRQHIGAYAPYILTNVVINFLMFSAFGEGVLALLKI